MNLQPLIKLAGITQHDLAYMLNIDVGNMSRIAVGRVLPRPEQLRLICTALNCKPLDIYEREEIDLINCMGKAEPKTRPAIPKVQFRRSKLASKVLDPDMLKLHGFDSAQAWFDDKIREEAELWKV